MLEFARSAIVAAVLFGLATLLFLKPSRILIPEMAGVVCPSPDICIERQDHLAPARTLYATTREEIESLLGPFERPPRVVFCSSTSCFKSFGFKDAAAQTVGRWGIVIGPAGWQPHYLRHEFIHHWQAERLGTIERWRAPEWIIEGMAYALSGDPRPELGEPFQSYRDRFLAWYRKSPERSLLAAIRQEL